MLTALKKSKLFLTGFILCGLLTVIAILGYCIAPDSSTNANRIVQEWKNLPPRTTRHYIEIIDSNQKQTNIVTVWLNGDPNPPALLPLDSEKQNILLPINSGKPKSITFWLGTDQFGRDVLSRMIIGSRVSLLIGFAAMVSSLLLGIFIGLIAGYFGGKTDKFLSWLIAVFWSVPTLLIAMGLSLFLPKVIYQFMVATALSTWV